MPFDSSRKTYDMNKAFIKITKIKTQICKKNTLIVLYNSTKIIVIATNISVMLVNHFNLFFIAKETDVILKISYLCMSKINWLSIKEA